MQPAFSPRAWPLIYRLVPLAALAAVLSVGWTITATGLVQSGVSARDLFSQAAYLAKHGHCEQAVPLYSEAISRNHSYVNALMGRAQCALALGADDVAIADYTSALHIDPMNYGVLLARAGAEVDNGSHGAAQIDALTALRLVPRQAPSYLSVAQILGEIADLVDAAQATSLAMQLLPNNATLYAQRATYEAEMLDVARSEADYGRAIALSPPGKQATLYSAVAAVQDQAQDYNAALHSIDRAMALRPGEIRFYLAAAGIERDAGNNAAAAIRFAQALSHGARGSQAVQAQEGRGDVLAAMGQKAAAMSAYRAALSLAHDRGAQTRLRTKIKALGS